MTGGHDTGLQGALMTSPSTPPLSPPLSLSRRVVQCWHPINNIKSLFAPADGSGKGRFRFLDGLRAIAVLWVLLFHTTMFYSTYVVDADLDFTSRPLPERLANAERHSKQIWDRVLFRLPMTGDLGVDVFFVLSGFLIVNVLWKHMAHTSALLMTAAASSSAPSASLDKSLLADDSSPVPPPSERGEGDEPGSSSSSSTSVSVVEGDEPGLTSSSSSSSSVHVIVPVASASSVSSSASVPAARSKFWFVHAFGLFLLRRFLRIWPALFMSVLITIFWAPFPLKYHVESTHVSCEHNWWKTLLFVNNFANKFIDGCIGQSWSVAVEFQFYLLSPFLVYLLRWPRSRIVPVLALVLPIVASLSIRAVLLSHYEFWRRSSLTVNTMSQFLDHMYAQFYTRAHAYMCGMAAAYVCKVHARTHHGLWLMSDERRARATRYALYIVAITVIALDVVYGTFWWRAVSPTWDGAVSDTTIWFLYMFRRASFAAGVAVFVACGACGCARGVRYVLSARFWYPLATLSYSAYLLQIFGIIFVVRMSHVSDVAANQVSILSLSVFYVFSVIIVFASALVQYLVIERPMINMRAVLRL